MLKAKSPLNGEVELEESYFELDVSEEYEAAARQEKCLYSECLNAEKKYIHELSNIVRSKNYYQL